MHKAIAIIQFKLEGQLYEKYPDWDMKDRGVLAKIHDTTISLYGKSYDLLDSVFPTLDESNPFMLTEEERRVVERLVYSFIISDKLQRHVQCLLSHGSMCGTYNSNLLFHASVPLNSDGSLRKVNVCGTKVSGKELMTRVEQEIRAAFDDGLDSAEREQACDYFWYLWCGPNSPLFDKSKMATFERYFVAEKETHEEEKGFYYRLREQADVCDKLMDAFGVIGKHRHIINGHVPVKVGSGENPIKADGRLMVIDGGFAKAYHHTTGIAGYTLVYHSRGFQLVQHAPFKSTEDAIANGTDIKSTTQIVEMMGRREMVSDTDKGEELRGQIVDLEKLLIAYRKGIIKEKES